MELPALVASGYATHHVVVGRTYRLEVGEPGTHHIDLRSYFFDACLIVSDDEGAFFAEDDDGLIDAHSRVVIPLDGSRSYLITA